MSGQPEFEMTSGRSRTDHDMCIVSCAIGPHYQEGIYSTRLHCEAHVPEAWRLFYRELPLGCPPHSEQMYAFKIYAMQRAIDAGFRYILWMDATFQPIASIAPLIDVIKQDGWYAPQQLTSKLGTWCSDKALDYFDIRREVAFTIPLVFSGLVGLDIRSENGADIWDLWKCSQSAGAWNGAHFNVTTIDVRPFGLKTRGHVSWDLSVEGHRHDEAALSAILYLKGLSPIPRDFLKLESPNGFMDRHVPLVIPGRAMGEVVRQLRKTIGGNL